MSNSDILGGGSFLQVGEEREDLILQNAGHHRPTSETPFKWRLAGGPKMAEY